VQQHGAQEEEAAKASQPFDGAQGRTVESNGLDFDASASGAEFEQAFFSVFSVPRASLGERA
jgi:hypothetical protein